MKTKQSTITLEQPVPVEKPKQQTLKPNLVKKSRQQILKEYENNYIKRLKIKSPELLIANEPNEMVKKLRIVANTLRNNIGISQIRYTLCKSETKVCAVGLLGLRSGIPANELKSMRNQEMTIFEKYGITKFDKKYTTEVPYTRGFSRNDNIINAVIRLNDIGYSFDEIAGFVDNYADKLNENGSKI